MQCHRMVFWGVICDVIALMSSQATCNGFQRKKYFPKKQEQFKVCKINLQIYVQLRPWVVVVVNELSYGNKTFGSKMRKHSQRHIRPRALGTLTHLTVLAQSRSFNSFKILVKFQLGFVWQRREMHRTNPCNNLNKSI